MSYRFACACALLPVLVCAAAAAQKVSRAYAGDDGSAHVVYANGTEKIIPPEQPQVGCENVSVAPNKQTIGWSMLVENCCTSYPIPTAVVVYRAGKKTVISPGWMIYEWHFVGRGDRIAVLFGPVHGSAAGANIYDARSGRLLDSWDGKSAAPEWANGWAAKFRQ